ncbi:hypothetical protein [Namhaeicola litoreus]|uniref:Arylsulfatase n=1 Tax=Namhaeicola litoreus TaxID=1052145 RepID=A0ABW3Y375_9FLAO
MIAFLHTSDIHIPKFDDLVKKFNSKIEVQHFVNAEILASALVNGKTDHETFCAEVEKIKASKPKLIICTCSTYGGECDDMEGIERIDLPIAKYLVKNYRRIALAYTALSTKKTSEDLLLKSAEQLHKTIEIVPCDCSDAWPFYESNDFENYGLVIAEKIRTIAPKVDVVFLAQASMEVAKQHLKGLSQNVYSSPEFGIKTFLHNFDLI